MIFLPRHNAAIERLSKFTLYGILSLTAVAFILFYAVGYDLPYMSNPNINAPYFTSLVINLCIGFVVLGFVGICISILLSIKRYKSKAVEVNNIPVKRITFSIVAGVIFTLVLSFILSSSDSLNINGHVFNNVFWLKISGMFICTSIIAIVIATVIVLLGTTGYYRKCKK